MNNYKLQTSAFFKKRIMTAGPTPVPDFIHSAMSSAVFYHRSPDFADVVKECRESLPKIFGTKNETLLFSGSGTLAMEGAIANFLNSGDEVVAVNGGKFGQRWVDQAKIYGLKVHQVEVPKGSAVNVEDIAKIIAENKNIKAILAHSSETSTGVRHNVKELAKLAASLDDCLMMVDAVTSLGVWGLPMDEWGVDVMVGGSQKGMMLPPGLSFGAASDKAWKRANKTTNVRYYMDWRKELKSTQKNTGAFTSAVTLIAGLRESLRYFIGTGIENVYKRNWQMAFSTRAAVEALGLNLFVKDPTIVSAVCTPVEINGDFPKILREKFSITLSGGQDELKGKIVRLGHLGYIDGWDLMCALTALAQTAKELGHEINLGAGIEAFWKSMNEQKDFTPEDLK